MASQWHYARGGAQLGPVSSEELRRLAAAGGLAPPPLGWKAGLPGWRPAGAVRGLFPEPAARPAGPPPLPTAPPEPSDPPGAGDSSLSKPGPDLFDRARDLTAKARAKAEALRREARANPSAAPAALARGVRSAADYARSDEGRDRARRAAEHPLAIGAALLAFFPLGLYLVWHHPRWTRARRWAWTVAWLGCSGLFFTSAVVGPRVGPVGWGTGGSTPSSGLDADKFRREIVGEVYSPKSKFFDLYGRPDRVVEIGNDTFLSYTCSDGPVVIQCPIGPYQYQDIVAPQSVDRR